MYNIMQLVLMYNWHCVSLHVLMCAIEEQCMCLYMKDHVYSLCTVYTVVLYVLLYYKYQLLSSLSKSVEVAGVFVCLWFIVVCSCCISVSI